MSGLELPSNTQLRDEFRASVRSVPLLWCLFLWLDRVTSVENQSLVLSFELTAPHMTLFCREPVS